MKTSRTYLRTKAALMFVVAAALVMPGRGAEAGQAGTEWYEVTGVAELGFLAPLAHSVQFGKDGSYFDYVEDGAQDTLFFVGRLSLELELFKRHTLILLYQPLELATSEYLLEDLVVDGERFVAGTPMQFKYGFPFYRLSYLYDLAESDGLEVAVGGSLQIRNATIDFRSADGRQLRSNRGVGPVPALKFRATYHWESGFFVGTELDGMYAPVSYLNGDDNNVEGAILDASVRAGLRLNDSIDVWLNLRYLGGGAQGDSDDDERGDGFTKNWLHFMTTTVGFSYTM